MSVTHVAGPFIGLSSTNRAIQRCLICGEKLIDTKNQASPNGEPSSFWRAGALIKVEGSQPACSSDIGDFLTDSELPDDLCISLVED